MSRGSRRCSGTRTAPRPRTPPLSGQRRASRPWPSTAPGSSCAGLRGCSSGSPHRCGSGRRGSWRPPGTTTPRGGQRRRSWRLGCWRITSSSTSRRRLARRSSRTCPGPRRPASRRPASTRPCWSSWPRSRPRSARPSRSACPSHPRARCRSGSCCRTSARAPRRTRASRGRCPCSPRAPAAAPRPRRTCTRACCSWGRGPRRRAR
mmetsp:Transcript_83129/g.217076  ORF Transcript_83129/g.217076 Transcript_83129/m.217076 type:complete len:206 (+) Transcript_83129:1746-2363(+)